MFDVLFNDIEIEKEKILKENGLDQESIEEFSKLIQVNEMMSEQLGKEIFDLLKPTKIKKPETDDLINQIKDLIIRGADVNYASEGKGMTSLMRAESKNYKEIFNMLIRAGAKIDKRTTFGSTCLSWACQHLNTRVVLLLLVLGANPNNYCSDGYTPLHSAIFHNDLDSVKLLIKHGAYIDSVNISGESIYDFVMKSTEQEIKDFMLPLFDEKQKSETINFDNPRKLILEARERANKINL